jgi:hypothetical protein
MMTERKKSHNDMEKKRKVMQTEVKDRKDENIKGMTKRKDRRDDRTMGRLDDREKSIHDDKYSKRTGAMTERKKRHNEKEKEDRHHKNKKEKA